MLRRPVVAMGTDGQLILDASDGPAARAALAAAAELVATAERALSRFRPDSDLSRLNRARTGRPGPLLRAAIERALALRGLTGGRFDPALGAAVRAAGYDRPFAAGLDRDDDAADPPVGFRSVAVDATGEVRLGDGAELDLGGIGKGLVAEWAAERLAAAGPALVDLGGDIAVRGVPAAGGWPVEVPTPGGPLVLGLRDRGLATSGTDRRRWRRGGSWMHHVIDPRTGRPARTDRVRVTCVARDAASAEAWATALLLSGRRRAQAECARVGVAAVLVGDDGGWATCGGIG
jgi:thiamine biosynthesis lipoprotein